MIVLRTFSTTEARRIAMYNLPPAYAQSIAARSGPGFRPHPLSTLGRLVSTKRVVHTLDYPIEVAGYKERANHHEVRLVQLCFDFCTMSR
jgi:hypothetical protein